MQTIFLIFSLIIFNANAEWQNTYEVFTLNTMKEISYWKKVSIPNLLTKAHTEKEADADN